MSEKIKNNGRSIRAKLLNIAKQEHVFFQTILTRYFQERLLYRMSLTQYKDNFYLKGGVLIYAYEQFAARPTLDIDFLGANISNDSDNIVKAFKEIGAVPCDEDGVSFDINHITAKNITELKDYHGIRISIPVTMDTIAQIMTMDIGFGDVVTPNPVPLDYPILLAHLPMANILAYSVETVIAEKMHAVIDLAEQSSRMKDYYDLYHILMTQIYDKSTLQEAVKRTFANRHTSFNQDTMLFRAEYPDNITMQTRWKAFMRKITSKSDLTFADVVRYLQMELKPYWENLKYGL